MYLTPWVVLRGCVQCLIQLEAVIRPEHQALANGPPPQVVFVVAHSSMTDAIELQASLVMT